MVVKSVLIVDDTDTIRSVIIRMVRDMGYSEIYQAKNGLAAIQILKENKIDLIISEWKLPKLSGKSLLLAVRKVPSMHKIPFIICSSSVDQSTVIEALESGVSQFLAKPFNYKMLRERVNSALEKPLHGIFNKGKPKEKNIGQNTEQDNNTLNHPLSNEDKHHLVETSSIASNSTANSVANKNFTILVVDDEINNIEIATKSIKSLARIKFALSGEKALQICKTSPPDLILLDIMMPEMDGYEVAKKLSNDVSLCDIPVIFLTAKSTEEDIVKGLSLGAVDYITKPFNMQILKMRVSNQLKAVEHFYSLDTQITEHIQSFKMKENVDRVLLNYVSTPIQQIDKAVERIAKKGSLAKQLKLETDDITLASRNIKQIIESLSTILKLEDSNFIPKLSAEYIKPIVQTVVSLYSREQFSKSLQVDNYISNHTKILCDPMLFKTLITELYINAIDATPRGAKISFFESVKDTDVEITIFTPTTVSREMQDVFFDKYTTHGKRNGTGLGTYAAKLISDISHARVELKAEENETRITLTFKKA